jgi:gamma-glutamylcyclotransferase (GGCT)/AIG2-like uncharacterized protein YtfP
MTETDKFFVYGTLKEGGHFADQFDEYRTAAMQAKLEGFELFNLGWFPAIKPGEGTVQGELHRYTNADMVRGMFDRIEGYTGDPKTSMYDRRRVTVTTDEGKEEAWAYVFMGKVDKKNKVKDGEWKLSAAAH